MKKINLILKLNISVAALVLALVMLFSFSAFAEPGEGSSDVSDIGGSSSSLVSDGGSSEEGSGSSDISSDSEGGSSDVGSSSDFIGSSDEMISSDELGTSSETVSDSGATSSRKPNISAGSVDDEDFQLEDNREDYVPPKDDVDDTPSVKEQPKKDNMFSLANALWLILLIPIGIIVISVAVLFVINKKSFITGKDDTVADDVYEYKEKKSKKRSSGENIYRPRD